jgi:hypothetical protein
MTGGFPWMPALFWGEPKDTRLQILRWGDDMGLGHQPKNWGTSPKIANGERALCSKLPRILVFSLIFRTIHIQKTSRWTTCSKPRIGWKSAGLPMFPWRSQCFTTYRWFKIRLPMFQALIGECGMCSTSSWTTNNLRSWADHGRSLVQLEPSKLNSMGYVHRFSRENLPETMDLSATMLFS